MGQLRVAAGLLLVVAAMAGVAPAAPGDGTLAARQHRRLSSRTRGSGSGQPSARPVAAAAAAAAAVALSSAAYFGRSLSDQRPRNVVAFFLAVLLLGADCALALPARRKLGAAAYGVLVATIALTLAVNAYVVNVVAFDDRASVLDRFQDPRKTRRAGRHHGFQDWDSARTRSSASSGRRGLRRVRGAASRVVRARRCVSWGASAASLWCLAGRARRLRDRRRRLRAARVETPGAEAGPGADFFTGFLRDPRFAADHADADAAAAARGALEAALEAARDDDDDDDDDGRRRRARRSRDRSRHRSFSSSGDHSAGGAATDDGGVELLELPGCKGDRGASSV
ncbi:hypothetical protein JL720_12202 [Aureococcus anophagefferens]|nr:hypothetical protein JL720_12202 [Aureococcus anophagefferens]